MLGCKSSWFDIFPVFYIPILLNGGWTTKMALVGPALLPAFTNVADQV